jgi:hypothetical protein
MARETVRYHAATQVVFLGIALLGCSEQGLGAATKANGQMAPTMPMGAWCSVRRSSSSSLPKSGDNRSSYSMQRCVRPGGLKIFRAGLRAVTLGHPEGTIPMIREPQHRLSSSSRPSPQQHPTMPKIRMSKSELFPTRKQEAPTSHEN